MGRITGRSMTKINLTKEQQDNHNEWVKAWNWFERHQRELSDNPEYAGNWVAVDGYGKVHSAGKTLDSLDKSLDLSRLCAQKVPYPEGRCQRCGKPDDQLIKWVGDGGIMALTHGHYSMWCQICAVGTQLQYARERAASIPVLEERLKEEQIRLGRDFEVKE